MTDDDDIVSLTVRPDLTLMLASGGRALEIEMTPQQAMDLAAMLIRRTAAAMNATPEDTARAMAMLVAHAVPTPPSPHLN